MPQPKRKPAGPVTLPAVSAEYDPAFAAHQGGVVHKKEGFFSRTAGRLFSTDREVGKGRGAIAPGKGVTSQDQQRAMMAAVEQAKATGDWSRIPPEFRPQSATPAGRQKLANEDVFQDERLRKAGLKFDPLPATRGRSNAVSGPAAAAQAKAAIDGGKDSAELVDAVKPIATGAFTATAGGMKAFGKTASTAQGQSIVDATGGLGGDILGGVSNALRIGDARRDLHSSDGATRLMAQDKQTDAAMKLGLDVVSTTKGALSKGATIADKFGDAGAKTQLTAAAAPIDIVLQGAKGTMEAKATHDHRKHAGALHGLEAQSQTSDEVLAMSIGGSASRHDRQKWVHGTKAGIHYYNAASSAVALGAAPVGGAMRTVGTVAEGVHGAADFTSEAYHAGKVQDLRREATYGEAGDGGAAATAALMREDPIHRAQTMLTKARGGDKNALDALARYGITPQVLASSKDDRLRELIVKKQDTKQVNKNIGQTASEGLDKVAGLGRTALGAIRGAPKEPVALPALTGAP